MLREQGCTLPGAIETDGGVVGMLSIWDGSGGQLVDGSFGSDESRT